MRTAKWALVIGLATLGTSIVARGSQDIREPVKKLGSVDQLLIRKYSPVDLRTLVANAEVVVRGVIAQTKSFLLANEVSTDCAVTVLSRIHGQAQVDSTTITIRRPGGTLSLEGGTVFAYEPDFPMFEVGEEYVLFLKRSPDGYYVLPHGAQGAFRVESGNVSQVSRDTGIWNQERGVIGLLQFSNEIAVAAKSETIVKTP
jgi:hypothetical protein